VPDFARAYQFASGRVPPANLLDLECEGTVASAPVRRARNHVEERFRLCRVHYNLLRSLGLVT
jgi:hypothetical protein